MRQLKFRAWHKTAIDKYTGDMLFVGDQYGTKHDLDCCRYFMDGQPVILMQFTGLLDRNGVEIYEGDILKLDPELRGAFEIPQIVIFEGAGFKYQSTSYFDHKCDISQSLCSMHVVIGNIYQNPDIDQQLED